MHVSLGCLYTSPCRIKAAPLIEHLKLVHELFPPESELDKAHKSLFSTPCKARATQVSRALPSTTTWIQSQVFNGIVTFCAVYLKCSNCLQTNLSESLERFLPPRTFVFINIGKYSTLSLLHDPFESRRPNSGTRPLISARALVPSKKITLLLPSKPTCFRVKNLY